MLFVVHISGLIEPVATATVQRPPINIVHRAQLLALQVHAGQFRKNAARHPYHVHTTEVATLIAMAGGTEAEIAGAHLHDSVETDPELMPVIFRQFGRAVGLIVYGLTDPPEFKGLPTLERKGLQAQRLLDKSPSVKKGKLADVISNIRSVVTDPPVLWSHEKCFETLLGAHLIAQVAWGHSVFLEREFAKAYREAETIYGPLPPL